MNEESAFDTKAAAVAVLRRAVEIAKRDYDADPNESLVMGHEWTALSRTADEALFRPTGSMDARALAKATALGELRESSEAQAFAEALAQDDALAPYLGKMAFSGGMGVTVSEEAMAEALIHFALRDDDWDAVADRAPEIWAQFVKAFLREQAQVTLVAPLRNFVGPTQAFSLGDGLVIDQMTDEEISRGIFVGVVTSPFPGSRGDVWVTSLWAVRMTYAEERIFTAPGESPSPEAAQQTQQRVTARVDGVLHALLLYQAGSVSAESAVAFPAESQPLNEGWFARLILGTKAGRPAPKYELKAGEVEEFRRFYNALLQARASHSELDVAVRRFGDAIGRTRPDDQLTDLIIALEALLLSDSERGEKRFQVALRVAAFVEMGNTKRCDVLGFVKRAYDVRSSIVQLLFGSHSAATAAALDSLGEFRAAADALAAANPIDSETIIPVAEHRQRGLERMVDFNLAARKAIKKAKWVGR